MSRLADIPPPPACSLFNIMPSVVTILNFLRRHGGKPELARMLRLLNESHMTHGEIAREFKMDPGQMSRFIDTNLLTVYVLKPDVKAIIDDVENEERMELQRYDRLAASVYDIATGRQTDTPTAR